MISISFTEMVIMVTVFWFLFRYYIGTKTKKIDFKRELKLLTVYMCIVVIFRIVYFPMNMVDGHIKPLVFDPGKITPLWINVVPIIHMFDDYDGWLINIIGNVTMFIPFGIFCPLCFRSVDNIGKTVLVGAALTSFIELSQLFFYNRCSDIDDLIMNTTGVLIGAVIFFSVRALHNRKESKVLENQEELKEQKAV